MDKRQLLTSERQRVKLPDNRLYGSRWVPGVFRGNKPTPPSSYPPYLRTAING